MQNCIIKTDVSDLFGHLSKKNKYVKIKSEAVKYLKHLANLFTLIFGINLMNDVIQEWYLRITFTTKEQMRERPTKSKSSQTVNYQKRTVP